MIYKSLQIHLDEEGKNSLYKLARWSKTLGLINYTLGFFNGVVAFPLLSGGYKMFLISIPSFIISGILIIMGLQLNRASLDIKNSIIKESDQEFLDSLKKIQKFFFLASALYFIGFILLFIMLNLGIPMNVERPDSLQIKVART